MYNTRAIARYYNDHNDYFIRFLPSHRRNNRNESYTKFENVYSKVYRAAITFLAYCTTMVSQPVCCNNTTYILHHIFQR